jgi:hypothetical protein
MVLREAVSVTALVFFLAIYIITVFIMFLARVVIVESDAMASRVGFIRVEIEGTAAWVPVR